MTNKIPVTKVVTRNGKQFFQTYHILPESASPAALARAQGAPPMQVSHEELGAAPVEFAHAIEQEPAFASMHAEDYLNGFQNSFEFGSEDPDAALFQYAEDNDPDEIHTAAFRAGFRAGKVALAGKDAGNYLLGNFTKQDVFSYSDYHLSTFVVAHNPFEVGEEVIIPKGTQYSTEATGDAINYTTRDIRVNVKESYQPYCVEKNEQLESINVGTITDADYPDAKFFVVPALLAANEKELYPAKLSDTAEVALRGKF